MRLRGGGLSPRSRLTSAHSPKPTPPPLLLEKVRRPSAAPRLSTAAAPAARAAAEAAPKSDRGPLNICGAPKGARKQSVKIYFWKPEIIGEDDKPKTNPARHGFTYVNGESVSSTKGRVQS